ncbi:hypothetical protein GO013_16460 [Pseudodesulfovibrio sp. JC047]|uniref:hypothetical protein n=1 Tax=Pseudodesulfovibrio sp. JC047 TaxID=2683199 RepID=UPI0013D49114|nr:hypothetical protein [Pseudodesulfovibrio sp. JC047]NDV21005.1 hypothetical protein [Pseudodesulfovibrio sp. JC047]
MSDNIIPFDNSLKVKIASRSLKKTCCRHRRSVVLDPDSRLLECDDCGAFVDPFDVLADIVNREVRLTSSREYLAHEVKKLRDEKRELDKEVKRLKAQRRYHAAKMSQNTTKTDQLLGNFE